MTMANDLAVRRALEAAGPDFDYNSIAYASFDDPPAGVHYPRQIDLAGHRGEFARLHVGRQSLPSLPPPFQRTHHGIDADERHPAQDEWGDRRRKIHPPANPQAATAPP